MQPLPRQLWELRGSHAGTSELMLRMLHRAAVFAHAGSPVSAALQRLQDQLMPGFLLVQPLQPSKKPRRGAPDTRVKIVPGPLARLPTTSQVIVPKIKDLYAVPVPLQHNTLISLCDCVPGPR